jgi:hypothetical protein
LSPHSLEDGFNDVFGFGAGNQHGGRHAIIAAVKFLTADNVLKWNAADPLVKQIFQRLRVGVSQDAVIVRIQILAFDAEYLPEQQFRRQPGV